MTAKLIRFVIATIIIVAVFLLGRWALETMGAGGNIIFLFTAIYAVAVVLGILYWLARYMEGNPPAL